MKKELITRTSRDFALGILASLIYTFSRQIVVLPLLAARLSAGDYGTLLTVIGLVNVMTALVGGSLNNLRLVQAQRYEGQERKGDFFLLCACGSVLCVGAGAILSVIFRLGVVCGALLCGCICVNNFYQYATAHFRLTLDFKRSLLLNCLVGSGYVLGALVFATRSLWPLIFLFGEGVGLFYALWATRAYKEGWGASALLWQTAKMMLTLAAVNLIGNLLMYADRVIIYPFLGSQSVSYFSVASFFGKSAGTVMAPIAGVLLGYFSQKSFRPSKRMFAQINAISLLLLAAFMAGCLLFAPFFTRALYPSLYEQSASFIPVANLGAAIQIAGNMAQPMILKFCHTGWLIGNQILYGAAYVTAAALLLPPCGLWGFCYASVIAGTVRLLTLYLIGFFKFE